MTHGFWSQYFSRPVPLWIGWKLEIANFFLTYAGWKRYADRLFHDLDLESKGPTGTASGQVFWAAKDCIDAWQEADIAKAHLGPQEPHCASCTCFGTTVELNHK